MRPLPWRKLGCVFQPSGEAGWCRTHAQMPTTIRLDDRIRVYYSTRDTCNRSSTGFFDVAIDDPLRVIYRHHRPVLSPGPPGTFDDSGAMASCAVACGTTIRLYYQGWNVGTTVPFRTAIGVAISHDGGTSFARHGSGPILECSVHDTSFVAMPFVLPEPTWRMWYASCTEWRPVADRLEPCYHIRQAVSADGIEWRHGDGVAIDYASPGEQALARPAVLPVEGGFAMWYSRRMISGFRDGGPSAYRMGYATSTDAVRWTRHDGQAGIDASPAGWDAEMIAYPNIVEVGDRRYLFYNGNGFGRSGIGVAMAGA
jgi:hypothetical protein